MRRSAWPPPQHAYGKLLGRLPQEPIRNVILAPVRGRGGAADATRRVASRDRLGGNWQIAQTLARNLLVTVSHDNRGTETAQITHEALIRERITELEVARPDGCEAPAGKG